MGKRKGRMDTSHCVNSQYCDMLRLFLLCLHATGNTSLRIANNSAVGLFLLYINTIKAMDKLKKFDLMTKIARELEDVRNSFQAVLEKIGKIEVDNIELGDKTIESKLPDIYQETATQVDTIKDILDAFLEKTEDFGDKNNVDKLCEQQEINNLK